MTLADQWARLTSILGQSISKTQNVRKLQAAAAQEIDLATYAFQGILEELSALMVLPVHREQAVVHVLEQTAPRAAAARKSLAA